MNTIILLEGSTRLNDSEYKGFAKGDTIWGNCSNPKELKRWGSAQKAEAKEELSKYRCSYTGGADLHNVVEHALEYCECDGNGEFVSGSDYDLADEL